MQNSNNLWSIADEMIIDTIAPALFSNDIGTHKLLLLVSFAMYFFFSYTIDWFWM